MTFSIDTSDRGDRGTWLLTHPLEQRLEQTEPHAVNLAHLLQNIGNLLAVL